MLQCDKTADNSCKKQTLNNNLQNNLTPNNFRAIFYKKKLKLILEEETNNGKDEYLVKWKGTKPDSWEPKEIILAMLKKYFGDFPTLVSKFLKK